VSTPLPTFSDVAKRPRWIGVLVVCILVAGVFAMLGQWQIDRAIEQGQADERDTESAVPLEQVAEPGSALTTEADGRLVAFSGTWTDDFATLAGRDQHGDEGSWVIGRVLVDRAAGDPASLAVALAWLPDPAAAGALADSLGAGATGELVGRLMPPEAPTMGDVQGGTREAMSVAELVNEWSDYDGAAYATYAILDEPSAAASDALVDGAEPVVSLRPEVDAQLNWLNVFYAIEWIAFMLFAFYLWYRLVKDALEREIEDIEDAEAEAAEAGGHRR
jgi:surfeit locus 1 family protein